MRQKSLLTLTLALVLGLAGPAFASSPQTPWEEGLPTAFASQGDDATPHAAADRAAVNRRASDCPVVVNVGEYPDATTSDCNNAARDAEVSPRTDRRSCRGQLRNGHILVIFYLALLAWYALGSLLMSMLWPRGERRRR